MQREQEDKELEERRRADEEKRKQEEVKSGSRREWGLKTAKSNNLPKMFRTRERQKLKRIERRRRRKGKRNANKCWASGSTREHVSNGD